MDLAEKTLRDDLAGASFRLGTRRGRWKLARLQWPFADFQIPKPPSKPGPSYFLLRVDCTGYPGAPTAQLWDARSDQALAEAHRPFGSGGVLTAFSSWQACLYHPIDRLARAHWAGHDELAWKAGFDIVTFLEIVHGLIHDAAYVQSTAPSAAAELPAELVEAGAA